tara:strand:- start:225 stop:989 length:765 start_codon:yes stop_codon:yes gene_type:complete
MGPSGIMSLDSFGDIGGAGAAGVDTDPGGGYDTGPGGGGFSGQGPSESKSAFESRKRNQREILQKAEQRQAERLSQLTGRNIRERRNISDFRARQSPFGIGSLFSTVLGFINPFLGLASRAITGIPGLATKTFDTFKNSPTLVDFINNMKTGSTVTDEDDEGTLLDQVSPDLPFAKSYLQSLQPTTITGTNYPGANAIKNETTRPDVNLLAQPAYNVDNTVRDDAFDYLNTGLADGGRIQYMNGGLTDLVDIYD